MSIKIEDIDKLDYSDVADPKGGHIPLSTPGQILESEFLVPLGITKYRLAKSTNVPASRVGEIINKGRAITADTDLRFCKFLGLSDGYFLRLQGQHDLEEQKRIIADEIAAIDPVAI